MSQRSRGVPAHRRKTRKNRRPPRLESARRWPRRMLVTANVATAALIVSSAAAFGYVRYREGQLRTVHLSHLSAQPPTQTSSTGSDKPSLPAMNILLVGNNTRTGLAPGEAAKFGTSTEVGGARSDVTMILHLDPAAHSASLLSIPRDLFVSLPAHSIAGPYGKIDAALNGINNNPATGPDNLIQTITDDLGIPINHYVSINFDGFQKTIDAIGGIKMSFPDPLRDYYSGLSITRTGCQLLDGGQALAVVRARHLQYFAGGRWQNDPESDLSRIVRDHTFLKVFAAAARSKLTNVFSANALIGGLLNQVTVDSGLDVNVLLQLFKDYRHVDPSSIPETTIPVTVANSYSYAGGSYGDVDMPVEPLDHQVIARWLGSPLPTSDPSTFKVQVVDDADSYSLTAKVASGLTRDGFGVTGSTGGYLHGDPAETVIAYHPGSVSQALAVLHDLQGAVMMSPDPKVADGMVVVHVGTAVSVAPPAAAPSAPAPATTVAPPSGATLTAPAAPATTTTTVPTAGTNTPSSATDEIASYDPTPCG